MKLPSFFTSPKNIKLKDSENLFILESLSTMLSSGIPITEALSSIDEDTNSKNTKEVVRSINESISSGKSLSESFGRFPESFDPVFLSIVKSGEASGKLDSVLQSASQNLKKNIQTKGDIKSALFYPAIIISVLFLVAFLVFGYSLPKVAKVFFDLHLKLPAYSTLVLKSALWFGDNKVTIILILVTVVLLLYFLLKIKTIKKLFFGLLFSLPIISNIVRLRDFSSFAQTTGLLLSAGVPIINALEISKNVVVSEKLRADLARVITELTEGSSLAKSMKTSSKSFPSLLRRVISVGEESGKLDQSLSEISEYYEHKFTAIIKNLTVVIEPVLIIFIAVLVALVLVSVVLPIYQGIGTINRH